MQFHFQFIVNQFGCDGVEGIGVFFALNWIHSIHYSKAVAWFAVFVTDTAGMHHVVSFVIIFYVADIWREEICTTFFTILPNLFDFHFFGVDSVTNAAREVFMVWNPVCWIFGTEMTVVKQHDIAIWQNYTSVLFILPVKFAQIANRFEEIFLHIFRPHFWVAQNPVQFAFTVFI